MSDKIEITKLKIFAYHGCNDFEKNDGQNFYLDIACKLDLQKPSKSDDLDDTVSYAKIVKLANLSFTKEKYNLIEKAAGEVADTILSEFSEIDEVIVKVFKPEAPVKADFENISVQICRKR